MNGAPLLRAHRRASLGAAGRHPWGWSPSRRGTPIAPSRHGSAVAPSPLSSLEVERRPSRSGSGESRVVLDRQSNSGDQYLGRSFTVGGRKHDEWAGQPSQVRTSGWPVKCFKRQSALASIAPVPKAPPPPNSKPLWRTLQEVCKAAQNEACASIGRLKKNALFCSRFSLFQNARGGV